MHTDRCDRCGRVLVRLHNAGGRWVFQGTQIIHDSTTCPGPGTGMPLSQTGRRR